MIKPSKLEKMLQKEIKKKFDLKFKIKVKKLTDEFYKVSAGNNYTLIDEEYLKRNDWLEDLTTKIGRWLLYGK